MRPSQGIAAAKQRIWLRLIRNDQLLLAVLALTVDVGGAYSAITFRLGIDAVQLMFYGAPSEEVYATALELEMLADLMLSDSDTEYYVVDKKRSLTGVILFSDAKIKILNPDSNISHTAKDLSKPSVLGLNVDDNLDQALQLFKSADASTLPVVESRQTMKLAGVIRHRDAILSYNQGLIRLRRQEHGET